MRKFFLLLLLVSVLQGGAQQTASLRDIFKQMPDSLTPYLSHNNKLDFIDFMDSNMKSEVSNLLGGKSEMTALTTDSLSIRMSETLRLDMLLLSPVASADSSAQVICVAQTFGVDSLGLQSRLDFYTTEWERLQSLPVFSSADQVRIDALKVQTILKIDSVILKKN